MSKSVLARFVVLAGAVSAAIGVFGVAGWPWAAIVAGGLTVGYGSLFIDVDDKPKRTRRR